MPMLYTTSNCDLQNISFHNDITWTVHVNNYTFTCVLYEVQGTNKIEGMGKNFELRVIECFFYWNIGKIDAIVECSQFTKTQIQVWKHIYVVFIVHFKVWCMQRNSFLFIVVSQLFDKSFWRLAYYISKIHDYGNFSINK